MPRTIVDIPQAQLRDVDRVCKALSISRAEAVRRALHAFVHDNATATVDGFGLWTCAEGAPNHRPRPSA